MPKASRDFQVFAKPAGALCNLDCQYCYYLKKERLYSKDEPSRMPDDVLEEYIVQHIQAAPDPVINFTWHGGEPTVLGLDYFRQIVDLQRKHLPSNRRISNGIQTNGTLLNDDWGRFFKAEKFAVGLSLDGPEEIHNRYRRTKNGEPTFERIMRGYRLLQRHRVPVDILCVVNDHNVNYPAEVYGFFKEIEAQYIGFLPLVEPEPKSESGVSSRTVPARALGDFLSVIFDEWKAHDIGRVVVQWFEEVAQTALGRDHALCIFSKTCGNLPVIERNGDFYSCDHFVDDEHRQGNINETSLVELLESPDQRAFGQTKLDSLPRYCRECEVRVMCNGGCPKDRFIPTPDGEPGLSYLCEGYKRFFNHCQPFARALAEQHRQRSLEQQKPKVHAGTGQIQPKVGRNDPCPCGSGLKYKKCCMNKVSA